MAKGHGVQERALEAELAHVCVCVCARTHVCTCIPFTKGQGKPSWGFAAWFPCKLSHPQAQKQLRGRGFFRIPAALPRLIWPQQTLRLNFTLLIIFKMSVKPLDLGSSKGNF